MPRPARSHRRRRILIRLALVGIALAIPIGLFASCSLSLTDLFHKISPSGSSHAAGGDAPAPTPDIFIVERQVEPHTCGYHALSTIYRAYGLSPEDLNLRFRLGTDNIAVPLDATSTGTIHPDIVRVAKQDGFKASMLGTSSSSVARARAHLATGHPIMVLTRTETGGLHWVTVTGALGDADRVIVYDSLIEDPYDRDAQTYLAESAISVITIRPKQ